LPNGCREIFYLYAIENFGHKEIAEKLSVTEGTSKSQYHRAKKLIREKFMKH
jgi:DNA-directed RNA polymerase specialized sigma24 family protein